MKRYVVGFMIKGGQVLLVEKDRPVEWVGLCTGPGGKIEPGELGPVAMVREFREETGIETTPFDWTHVATVRTGLYEVEFYRADGDPFRYRRQPGETESLFVVEATDPGVEMFANARWALALCLDRDVAGPVIVDYNLQRKADQAMSLSAACGLIVTTYRGKTGVMQVPAGAD